MLYYLLLFVQCSVAGEEQQTVSIDVMDVSDFDGIDDNCMNDEVVLSPQPLSEPRPPSQNTGRDSPRVAVTGRRLQARTQFSQHSTDNVCTCVSSDYHVSK